MAALLQLHTWRAWGRSTLGLENGEDLKEMSDRLGHSTITTTADRYVHVSERRLRAATDRRDARLYRDASS